jgi:hypothetical protein
MTTLILTFAIASALSDGQHSHDLKQRGAAAMGFDQDTTEHHFLIQPDGGAIEVRTISAADIKGRDQIRAHLRQIAAEFAAGDFGKPFAVHGEQPPGVAVMRVKKGAIQFRFEAARDGGRVRIITKDPEARAAIHDFLRYQIREHATDDPIAGRK